MKLLGKVYCVVAAFAVFYGMFYLLHIVYSRLAWWSLPTGLLVSLFGMVTIVGLLISAVED